MFSPDISNDGSTRDACEEIVEKKKERERHKIITYHTSQPVSFNQLLAREPSTLTTDLINHISTGRNWNEGNVHVLS